MNILLWIIQILVALHTATGAVWKFSNSPEQTMPSLKAIPHGAWISMAVAELIVSLLLIVPAFYRPMAWLIPLAAAFIVVEMLLYVALQMSAGDTTTGPIVYWLVTAAICAFLAYGRWSLKPQ